MVLCGVFVGFGMVVWYVSDRITKMIETSHGLFVIGESFYSILYSVRWYDNYEIISISEQITESRELTFIH